MMEGARFFRCMERRRPMKVLQINSVCGIRSTGRIASDIHQLLVEKGHEGVIAYGQLEAKNCDRTIKIGSKKDLYVHGIMSRAFDRHGFGSKKATEEFLQEVESYQPDLIHLHNIHGYYLHVGLLFEYIKKRGIPVVWTLHDCWSFTGHCAYFDFVGCEKWKTGCHACPQKKSYPASLILDQSKRNYEDKKELFQGVRNLTFVTPSHWLQGLLKESYLGGYNSVVIPNGIDLSTFRPAESDFRRKHQLEGKFVMLMVSSEWTPRKGLKYLLEFQKSMKDDEKLVLVGLTEELKKELPDSIVKITRTDHVKELAEIYASCDVLLNPTLEDNFPTTNLEALACGTPVITFRTGGSPEAVDEQTGIVIDQGNLEELRDAVDLMREKGKAHYSGQARKRAEDLYAREDRYKDYIALYEGILRGYR